MDTCSMKARRHRHYNFDPRNGGTKCKQIWPAAIRKFLVSAVSFCYTSKKGSESVEKNMKSSFVCADLWLWAGTIFFYLLGFVCIVFAIFPDIEPVVSRDALQTKVVTVSELDYHVGHRSANTYYIRTTEGHKYIISGSFDRSGLAKNLTAEKIATVKWFQRSWPSACLAEEIFVDGKQVVYYNNDRRMDWEITFVMGITALIMGMAVFAAIRYDRKLEKDSREKKSKKRKGK